MTPDYEIVRIRETEHATFGRMYDARGGEICVTLELPWVDRDGNQRRDPNVSRIVPGTYRCVRKVSPKRGIAVWWLCAVPDATLAGFTDEPDATTIQIHVANVPNDLNGCIGVGTAFGRVKEQDGITGSTFAFHKFMEDTRTKETITIRIVEQFG